jgi:uncharacterized membrane protein YgcG
MSKMKFCVCLIICALALGVSVVARGALAQEPPPPDQGQAPPPDQGQASPPPDQPAPAHLSPQQLQGLVAPIALYPDSLVAQILAAAAYPTQIVEAARFLQENPDLKGKALADQVDQQDWDPSVKALTAFPSVLQDMNKNLSWTSELGDANYNQSADVMDAIQVLRRQAHDAGHLNSTPQETVTQQGDDYDIAPADPDVVYVPVYDPAVVFGYPVALWPGLYDPWWQPGVYLSFGVGFGVAPYFGFGWGWGNWGCDWYNHGLLFGGGAYAFHSHAFYDRQAYFHGDYRGFRGPYARGDRGMRGFGGAERGFGRPGMESRGMAGRGIEGRSMGGGRIAENHGPVGRSMAPRGGVSGIYRGHTGAFGQINHGGFSRGFSSRGRASFGGGGFHGGGFHGGGPRGGRR